MSRIVPDREWWTAEELAASGLPGVPTSRQGVDAAAKRRSWREYPQFARRRQGRGGGWEYHWKLLPAAAQKVLVRDAAGPVAAPPNCAETWAWFDGLPEATKAAARQRLRIVQQVEALEGVMGKYLAVANVAESEGVGRRTIWAWFALVEGVELADRLAYLAPRHRAAAPRPRDVEVHQELWELLKGDFLRLEGPAFAAAFRRVARIAEARGWPVPNERTARRRMAEVPRVTRVFAREGLAGLEKCFPPQTRDRTGMVALEGVNADCHKIDVFVAWPGVDAPMRPQIVAFQDIYSGKILSWRVDRDPNKVAVMSAFGELVETWGIPRHCTFDNGREFANKWLTGGTATRFRFKVREDDPLGVLPQMGIEVHWARPHHGQAKPIERAFRDLADSVARDPRFAGAYVGNRPDAKPENYASRAIPLDDFMAVLEDGITEHNARAGRLTDTARGRSFDQTFAESYERAPIRRATAEMRRLWLMGQQVVKLHARHGQATLLGGEYWSDWMSEVAGARVIVRFDPEDLHAGVHVYGLDGGFLGFAEAKVKTPFYDLASAQAHAKEQARRRREERRRLDAMRPRTAADVAAALDAVPRPEPAPLEAKVVQLAQLAQRARGPLVERPMPQVEETAADAERHSAFVVDFRREAAAEAAPEETSADRFRRALAIEARAEAGEPVGEAEAGWLAVYRDTPEYRATRALYDEWGEIGIG